MSWIRRISFAEATGALRRLYSRVAGPDGHLDNILQIHSLRPHTLKGHMTLYKAVLHHTGNQLPKHELEILGVFVSLLNGCAYCVEHHYAGLVRLLDDPERARTIRSALEDGDWAAAFDARMQAALQYAEVLTRTPEAMAEAQIVTLREAGYDDGDMLEINQVVAYFANANRTVLGLGVSLDGDVLGTSPGNSDDPDDWQHG